MNKISGVWISPLGEEHDFLCAHPYKDEICLLGVGGGVRWVSMYQLVSRWRKK
jgi:hypothetical protein